MAGPGGAAVTACQAVHDKMLPLLLLAVTQAQAGPSEKRLIDFLLNSGYNPLERPVADQIDSVPLQFGI